MILNHKQEELIRGLVQEIEAKERRLNYLPIFPNR